MISRRALLVSAAPAALALGGCSSAKLAGIADSAYVQLVTVARVIEKAVATIVADVKAAIAMVTPYIVPACRIVVSMDTMAQTLISNGSLKPATGSTLSTVLENLHTTATASAVAATAQTGALPSDPVTIATDIIQLASLVIKATGKKVTPTAAVA